MTENESIPTEDQTEVEPEQDQNEPESNPNAEAAKWRTRLRDTEAERDSLAARLDAARRQIAEHHSGLTRPGALWAAGVDPSSLFDDDGQLDHDRLTAAVTQAADQLGVETRQARANRSYWQGGPLGPATSSGSSRDRDRFADAFRPRG